jgi:signal transduction histidine kinase/ActR/RegA family two-component response regulator
MRDPSSREGLVAHLPLGRVVVVGAAIVNAAAIVTVVLFLAQSRSQMRAAAVTNGQNMARLLDENLSASFDRIDLALQGVIDEVTLAGTAHLDAPAIETELVRQMARTPDLVALRVFDASGALVRSSPATTEHLNYGDRDYFQELRAGAATAVSKPFLGRISKAPIMAFGRRLVDGEGRFAGVVAGAVGLEHMAQMVSNPDVGPSGAIALRTSDLTLVARSDSRKGAPPGLGQSAVSPQMMALHKSGVSAATFDALSPVDDVSRTYALRRLARYPFYVLVGQAPDDYLAGFRRQVTVAGLLLATFVVLTSLGAVLIRRSWRHQQRAEEDLARVQKVESLAVLAGGIAHDFNNLLTGIAGNISLAREEVLAGSPAGEALADAEAASMRARGLTHQLLTFSRGGAPVKKRLDLSPVVAEAAHFAAHGAGTALRLETTPGLEVEVDPGQLGQVVQNLVLNGIQAMGSSGTLVVRTERATVAEGDSRGWRPGRYALLRVKDTGPGIPATVLPRIFDPFFTTKSSGKGLGLAICHSIVVKHDGHIEVSSPPGQGATFEVWLPAVEEAVQAPAKRTAEPGTRAAAPRRLLVMDDEDTVRHLAVRLLKPLGYEVIEARDGEEAVARYAEAQTTGRPFDAVLMDLTIPGGMGGLEALRRLRQLDPRVVAVVSSGYSNDPVMASFAEHGFKDVLAKPYVADELRDTLRRALDR